MFKQLLSLSVILIFSLTSCQGGDDQNLDIYVTGKVTDQNDIGVGDVSIFIQRGGNHSNYGPTSYNNYETIKTNLNGDYRYIVKNDNYSYKLCCGIPPGYTSVDEFCKFVNHNIINSHTIPNIINFQLQ